MKVRSAAEIHREIAALHVELAELAANDTDADAQPAPKPKRRTRAARPFHAPLQPVAETDMMRARQALRRRGITP